MPAPTAHPVLELQLLTLLSGLAAVLFAACAPGWRLAGAAMLGANLAATATLGTGRMIAPAGAAAMIFVGAGVLLIRPELGTVAAPLLAALSATVWTAALTAQGAPLPLAATGACGLLVTAWLLMRRQPRFAPAIVREEALLIVAGLGVMLAIGPNITAGWRSALTLRAEPLVAMAPSSAVWVFIVVGACLSAGGVFAIWRRGR